MPEPDAAQQLDRRIDRRIDRQPGRFEVFGVTGIPEVVAGDDLGDVIVAALATTGARLEDGDVVVVSSKVVSKAEGRTVLASSREDAIDAETLRIVAERVNDRGLTRVVRSRSGPVLAAAGVDASNVRPGTVLLLPADPDAGARRLRRDLESASGARVGVVVSDTAGRAWRDGQTDFALGAAGVLIVDDLRGATDTFGTPLEVTVRALADELAAAADLVKGKLRGVPVAVVRGLGALVTPDDGPGARRLLRTAATDWFALGHVEAVRSALGVPPGTPGVPAVPMAPDGAASRLRRALDVALAAPDPLGGGPTGVSTEITQGPDREALAVLTLPSTPAPAVEVAGTPAVEVPGTPERQGRSLLALGALVQRLTAAAWSEGLSTEVVADLPRTVRIHARTPMAAPDP